MNIKIDNADEYVAFLRIKHLKKWNIIKLVIYTLLVIISIQFLITLGIIWVFPKNQITQKEWYVSIAFFSVLFFIVTLSTWRLISNIYLGLIIFNKKDNIQLKIIKTYTILNGVYWKYKHIFIK